MTINRRDFLRVGSTGLGGWCAASLAIAPTLQAEEVPSPKKPNLPPPVRKAKSIVHLYLADGPSQLEMFDHKPELARLDGQPPPTSVRLGPELQSQRGGLKLLGPRLKFTKHGKGGIDFSEALPQLAKQADDLCVIRSCHTDDLAVAAAERLLHTGYATPGRPSLGSWVCQGVGTQNDNLPGFVLLSDQTAKRDQPIWSAAGLPPLVMGCLLNDVGEALPGLISPPGISDSIQRDTLDALFILGQHRRSPAFDAVIKQFESAYRLQHALPELLDTSKESQTTIDYYGCDPAKPTFARHCLLARRLVERGVRYIGVHFNPASSAAGARTTALSLGQAFDQGAAALIKDLKERGLLQETLIVCSGAFGRSPLAEPATDPGGEFARRTQTSAFTVWMAGGGTKGGLTYGTTDSLGFRPAENPVHIRDVQATLLYLAGIDAAKLQFNGGTQRLHIADHGGKVIPAILA